MQHHGKAYMSCLLWCLFWSSYSPQACRAFPGAKPAYPTSRTSNHPEQPNIPFDQNNRHLAYDNVAHDTIPTSVFEKLVKRQLNLNVSLKIKCFCNVSSPAYNIHFLIRVFWIMTKRLITPVIQRKTWNFAQLRPRHRFYQLHRHRWV